MQLTTGILSLS